MVAKVGVILIHLVMIWLGLQLSVGSHVLRGLSVRACECACVFMLGVARGGWQRITLSVLLVPCTVFFNAGSLTGLEFSNRLSWQAGWPVEPRDSVSLRCPTFGNTNVGHHR